MTIWIIAFAIAAIAALWTAFPFLRSATMEMNDSDGAISVFRDQLDELDRDLAAGLISEHERAAAAQEIERRTVTAARNVDGGITVSHRSVAGAVALSATVALIALGGYAIFGSPGSPDQPLAARKTEKLEQRANSGDPRARIALLIARTKENPRSFEDWWTLAAAYTAIGDDASSVDAYRHAATLRPDDLGVQSALAEAMTLANGNKVPSAARIIFESILKKKPDPRARYYVALAKAQDQDFAGALEDWVALKDDSKPDAPWMPLVRRDITNMVRFLGRDLSEYLPDASDAEVAAAGGMAGDQHNLDRISELETQLAEDPVNYEAWIELAQRRAQTGDNAGAEKALSEGVRHFAGAPFVLQKFNEAANALGLRLSDDAAASRTGDIAQPSAEDVARITALPKSDQDELIQGMVAGLAAELAEKPDNLQKWVMLVRSYASLGEDEKANAALERAQAHYAGNKKALDALASGTQDVLSR